MFAMYRSCLAASIRQNSLLRLVRICISHVWSKWCAGEGGVRPAVEALPIPTPLLPWSRTGRPRSSTSPANGSVDLMQVLLVVGSFDRARLFRWGEKDIDEFKIKNQKQCSLGCNEFIFYSIFIWLTLFSLYFSILRTICFLTFFDSRPPSFAKLTFCRFKFSKEAVGTKFGYFLSEYFLGTNCMPL